MDGISGGYFPFLAVGANRAGLTLRALRNHGDDVPLLLHCHGIEVGRFQPAEPIAAGTVIEIPIDRLPRVPLPAELRLSTTPDGPDLVSPWQLADAAAALSLLGAPDVRVEDLRMDHGVLRGTGREARNGLIEPVLFARINGAGARIATVEPPIALPEGGCAFRFALPIQPGDLGEAGLSVDLHLIGQDAPIGRYTWTRSGVGEAERRLVDMEGRLRQLEEESAAAQQTLQATFRRQLELQQERIDAFIAAAATLLLDRLAVAPGQEQDALRDLLAAAGPVRAGQPALDITARQLLVMPEDGVFGAGWHREEIYPTGAFRWMSPRGLLLNPAPERPLAGIRLEICHLYKADAPALSVQFDDAPGDLRVSSDGQGGFTALITPPGGPRPARVLRLASLTGGSPAEDGASPDRRLLSFAISRIVFDYADAPAR